MRYGPEGCAFRQFALGRFAPTIRRSAP